jgi:hypothetical protein
VAGDQRVKEARWPGSGRRIETRCGQLRQKTARSTAPRRSRTLAGPAFALGAGGEVVARGSPLLAIRRAQEMLGER